MARHVVYDNIERTAERHNMIGVKIIFQTVDTDYWTFEDEYTFEGNDILDLNLTSGTMLGVEELPIGKLTAQIKTQWIPDGEYWIRVTNHNNPVAVYKLESLLFKDGGYYEIEACSALTMLDIQVPTAYYQGVSPLDVLEDIFSQVFGSAYPYFVTITNAVRSAAASIYGYFPAQTLRERLQQLCLAARLRVITLGNAIPLTIDYIPFEVSSASTSTHLYQKNRVYMRPSLTRNVSKGLKGKNYMFSPASEYDIQVVDDWIEVNGVYYKVSSTDTLYGDGAIDLSDVYVSLSSVVWRSLALNYLGVYGDNVKDSYEIRASVLMNGLDLVEGDHITLDCYTRDDVFNGNIYSGCIGEISLSFGYDKIKADIVVPFATYAGDCKLTLYYLDPNNNLIQKDVFHFAEGDSYSVVLPQNIEKIDGNTLTIYCNHSNHTATGTLSVDTTRSFTYSPVLSYNILTKEVLILDTDGATISSGVVSIE